MWEPFTERARRSIVLAQEEAQRLGNNYIGTEHLLIGLMREGEGVAAGVLESLGVNLDKIRAETSRILSQTGQQAQSSSGGKSSTRTPTLDQLGIDPKRGGDHAGRNATIERPLDHVMFLDGRKPVHPLVVGEGLVVIGDDAWRGRFSLFHDGMQPQMPIQ